MKASKEQVGTRKVMKEVEEPVNEVRVVMTLEEAADLRLLCGRVGGQAQVGTVRQTLSSMYSQLGLVLKDVKRDSAAEDRSLDGLAFNDRLWFKPINK